MKNGKQSRGNRVANFPIIVHCHLSWDWVWQRPQQFLSRFSARHRVLFVEMQPPTDRLNEPQAEIKATDFPGLTVLQLRFPAARWSDGEYVDRERRRLVKDALAGPLAGQFDDPVQWFYDPMAAPSFAGYMKERAIVYDCMDELSKFKGAPPELIERERQLLAAADVVFTGGRKMYESKRRYNPNCHFYGCGVDVEHFAKARLAATEMPTDLAGIPAPRLGYFGVVDERLDYELLDMLAAKNPQWNIVIVGPVAKVDPTAFPRHKNLHWLGGRPYSILPNYVKGFEACLMPFARNESTEYINPTKALEYMAAGRPIVSTAVPDVVTNFGDVVAIAQTPLAFEELCLKAVNAPQFARIRKGLKMAKQNTWESIVEKMEAHIQDALQRNGVEPVSEKVLRRGVTTSEDILVPVPAAVA